MSCVNKFKDKNKKVIENLCYGIRKDGLNIISKNNEQVELLIMFKYEKYL
jgi:hypothetical protein